MREVVGAASSRELLPAWMLAGALLAPGTLIALAAMATGFIELLKVDAEHPATRDLNRHLLLMPSAWCLLRPAFSCACRAPR